MYRELFIKEFSLLGQRIYEYLSFSKGNELLSSAIERSFLVNSFFTTAMQKESLSAITRSFLNPGELGMWTEVYQEYIAESDKSVLIVMAGNLPLVGFHDWLAVMASGMKANIKLSSKDNSLLPAIIDLLCEINPYWRTRNSFVSGNNLSGDMVIATGGDETASFFHKLFKTTPTLIRGAKFSAAFLNGSESDSDITALARDLFLYYGLGCRSVSTLLLPEGYDLSSLVKKLSFNRFVTIGSDSYDACYKYQKAISIMNNMWFVDGLFFLFRKENTFPPPCSVIAVIFYKEISEVDRFINERADSLQCMVNYPFKEEFLQFGQTQSPSINQYADGVNTLEFLLKNR